MKMGAIYLVKNMQVSARPKHIDIRQHFMRELQARGDISIRFKRSVDNTSDIMTKNTKEKSMRDIPRELTLGL
jgi:hypothetical protein